MKESGFTHWQIADALGVNENTLSRWLRHELEPEKAAAIKAAIEKCKAARKEDSAA